MEETEESMKQTSEEIVIIKKVAFSQNTLQKLKAIGVLFENELENTKEPYLLGKGIEKVFTRCKNDVLNSFFMQ